MRLVSSCAERADIASIFQNASSFRAAFGELVLPMGWRGVTSVREMCMNACVRVCVQLAESRACPRASCDRARAHAATPDSLMAGAMVNRGRGCCAPRGWRRGLGSPRVTPRGDLRRLRHGRRRARRLQRAQGTVCTVRMRGCAFGLIPGSSPLLCLPWAPTRLGGNGRAAVGGIAARPPRAAPAFPGAGRSAHRRRCGRGGRAPSVVGVALAT